ncbi:MAG: hypothetical protein JWQ22_1280 [Devosia sp.]|nr:hypothetical protein [Devosia sp.]
MKFTIYSALDGRVFFGGDCEDPGVLALVGQLLLEGEQHADGWIENGQHHHIPERPSRAHVWDWATKTWIDPRTLQDLKDAKWEEVKRWRAQARIAPLMQTRFGIFDADDEAVGNIKDTVAGLTAAAAIGAEPETIRWTMADENPEQYVTLTPNELREVGVLLMSRGYAAHDRSRALFDQIASVTSAQQLDSITWD